ncbi:hypothetical protein ACSQ67_018869 [Phaseolus vulgaris]
MIENHLSIGLSLGWLQLTGTRMMILKFLLPNGGMVTALPNSTNSYKEDQKVNWHAPPIEERLKKALSEASVISQRHAFLFKLWVVLELYSLV